MRLEASSQVFRIAFLAITAASTLTSALVSLGHGGLAPYVLSTGAVASPLFAYVYVELGVFNRKNRERVDRGDNFAGPGMAMAGLLRAEQLAAAVAALEDGKDSQKVRAELETVTQERLRDFRNGIDLETIYDKSDQFSAARAVADGGSLVPQCTNCNAAGVSDEHKGDDVIACPTCEGILYREVTPE
jgi:DNA-directed RNA polymerase subunit RPC12/RpoP